MRSALRSALGILVLLGSSLVGCQTNYVDHAHQVRELLGQERYRDAAQHELDFKAGYGKDSTVLALLNEGALLHDAGRYEESSICLRQAEDKLIDFYRRSAGGSIARATVTGAAGDYLGEDYERVLVDVYGIENELARGHNSDALVEARRLIEQLQVLQDAKGHGHRYHTDGFAYWLAGTLFEDDGDLGNARVSYRAALKAFHESNADLKLVEELCHDARRAASRAGISENEGDECSEPVATSASATTPATTSATTSAVTYVAHDDETPLDAHQGELVLLHAAGMVPEREQVVRDCADLAGISNCWDEGQSAPSEVGAVTRVALPVLHKVPYRIHSAEIWVDGKLLARTQSMEDVEGIATRTLEDEMPGLQAESLARALSHTAASVVAGAGSGALAQHEMSSSQNSNSSSTSTSKQPDAQTQKSTSASSSSNSPGLNPTAALIGIAVGLITQVALNAAEEADRRSWFALPASFGVARARLPAGVHTVEVHALDPEGRLAHTFDFGKVNVPAGKHAWLGLRTIQ
jgi:hypothetical protein